jgi:hypothetical protein
VNAFRNTREPAEARGMQVRSSFCCQDLDSSSSASEKGKRRAGERPLES